MSKEGKMNKWAIAAYRKTASYEHLTIENVLVIIKIDFKK